MRFDEQNLLWKNFLLNSTFAILSMFQETIMPDANVITTKKMVKKKKYPRIISVLKESIRATTITMGILDLNINLTVGKLLALVLAIESSL